MARTRWNGSAALRPMLVPVDALRAHEQNPRRGAVEEIRKSLRRFGQQRPLLALPDGTLVAGHHVWQAAQAEGWSHVAVIRSDLTEKAVAYMLADNRLGDLGVYDEPMLAEHLERLKGRDALEGTGYTYEDVDELLLVLAPPSVPGASEDGAYTWRIILAFDRATYERLTARLDELAEAGGHESYSRTVEELVGATG